MENQEYLSLFIEESQQNLLELNEGLLELENHPEDVHILQTMFRSAHTLKGMAASMHFEHMAHLTHEMESSFDGLRTGSLRVTEEVITVLFECVDVLQRQLDHIIENGSDDAIPVEDVILHIRGLSGSAKIDGAFDAVSGEPLNEAVQTAVERAIDDGLHVFEVTVEIEKDSPMQAVRAFMVKRAYEEVGEVLWSDPADPATEPFHGTLRLALATHVDELAVKQTGLDLIEVADVAVKDLSQPREEAAVSMVLESRPEAASGASPTADEKTLQRSVATKTVRVDVDRLDTLMNLYSEFIIDKTRLEQLTRSIDHPELRDTVQHLARVGSDLQDIIMKIRMIPIDTVFNRFPRMVRDLSKQLNKKVAFEMQGADTEIDRLLADELVDPLVHMLRNSMDHGLETPHERTLNGKDPMGRIRMSAYHSGNHVFIEIADDGRGIDRERVLSKAVQQGILLASDAERWTDEQVYGLLFRSGFSTASVVSDISGRGVGLDAVREKIQSLGGEVVVRSELARGSTFVIQLPLTVSILSAMLVQVGTETFAIPTSSILHMDHIGLDGVNTVQGKPVFDFRGRFIPLVYLRDVYGVSSEPGVDQSEEASVAVLGKGDKKLAVVVDQFIGQQEVVLKSLGSYVEGSVGGISGAAILGDGQVSLIVDPNWLIE